MLVKLFLFAIPGSGKSKVAQHIVNAVNLFEGWSASRISDYEFLYKWFLEDKDYCDFEPVDHGGFHVKSISTYNKALKAIDNVLKAKEEKRAALDSLPAKENQL